VDAIYVSTGLILSFYNSRKKKIMLYPKSPVKLQELARQEHIAEKIDHLENENGESTFLTNAINCIWAVIPTKCVSDCDYCVIGPVLTDSVSKVQIRKFYAQSGLTIMEAAEIEAEYAAIPVMPYPLLMQMYQYVYYCLTGKKADMNVLPDRKYQKDTAAELDTEQTEAARKRDYTLSAETEAFLCDCVRNGNVERIRQRNLGALCDLAELGPTEARSLKNSMIIGIALITRAAIRGGVAPGIAFPLSDRYINRIEALSAVTDITQMYSDAAVTFTDLVRKNKFRLTYSKLINQCCEYILQNSEKAVRVTDVAAAAGVHPDTLTRKFRAETGISVPDYIRQVKTEEAKVLLLHTDKSLLEISDILSYSSQSQFIVSFRKQEGITPNAFRTASRRERTDDF
jgi:AraC-like DNA-binding protein